MAIREKLAEIYVDITGSLKKLRGILSNARSMVNKASQRLGRMTKRFALAAGVAIAAGLAFALKAAMRQEESLARLEAALHSTGHAAGLTKKELVDHAKALQKVTVYGDEAIEEMQALLLTFVNIKGEIFKNTTKAIMDVSSAMKQELVPTALQLGKALNDPILGLTMLRRVGISFSDEQVKTIKALWNTGRQAEAQTLILKELEMEFGGMSEVITTARGRLRQLWNVIGDVAETIGDLLIPRIKKVALRTKNWFIVNEKLIGQKADKYFSKIGVALGFLAFHIKKITYTMAALVAVLVAAKAVTIGIGLKALLVFLLANPIALVIGGITVAMIALYAAITLGATKAAKAMKEQSDAFAELGVQEASLSKKRKQIAKLRKTEEADNKVKMRRLRLEIAAEKESVRLGEAQIRLRRRDRHAELVAGREVLGYDAYTKGQKVLREQITTRESLIEILDAELKVLEELTAAQKKAEEATTAKKQARDVEQKALEKRAEILKKLGYEEEYQKALDELHRNEAAEYKKFLGDKYNEDEIYNRLKLTGQKKTKLAVLQERASMYRSMKGFDKQYQAVQQQIWREQAKEYAKTGLMTAEEAFAGLKAKAQEPLKVAADRAKIGLVGFEQAWSQIATGTQKIEQAQLKEAQKQTPYLKNIAEKTTIIAAKENKGGFGP